MIGVALVSFLYFKDNVEAAQHYPYGARATIDSHLEVGHNAENTNHPSIGGDEIDRDVGTAEVVLGMNKGVDSYVTKKDHAGDNTGLNMKCSPARTATVRVSSIEHASQLDPQSMICPEAGSSIQEGANTNTFQAQGTVKANKRFWI